MTGTDSTFWGMNWSFAPKSSLQPPLTASSCLVDLGGSLAVASKGLFATGVSTDLNVTYINSGGKIGDTLRAEATCDKFGKSLAYTSIRFLNSKGDLVARGSHTKYVVLCVCGRATVMRLTNE